MAVVTVTAWRCDFPTCGHVWYSEKEPLRCSKCKRKNWNKVKGDVVRAPKTRKRKPAGKGTAKPPATSMRNPEVALQEEPIQEPPCFIYKPRSVGMTEVTRDIGDRCEINTTTQGCEKPLPAAIVEIVPEPPQPEPVLPTIVRQPTAAKYREILKQLAAPEHKIGQKCPHGWANWLQCPKCNQR